MREEATLDSLDSQLKVSERADHVPRLSSAFHAARSPLQRVTSFRVTHPRLVLLAACLSGWRYLVAVRQHDEEVQERSAGARVVQRASRVHTRRRKAKSAAKIQANIRGKNARRSLAARQPQDDHEEAAGPRAPAAE